MKMTILEIADHLAELYDRSFGGKERGRFRISDKLVRKLAGRRRLYEEDITALSRALTARAGVPSVSATV